MSKTQYPTKYQITKLEQRVDEELDPVINLAELELKAVLTEETENAMTYLAKKIKADTVIDNLQKAVAIIKKHGCLNELNNFWFNHGIKKEYNSYDVYSWLGY